MPTIRTKDWSLKDVDAILFDKDGTLIDLHRYWGQIVLLRSYALIKKYDLYDTYFGQICHVMGYSVITKRLSPKGLVGRVPRDEVIEGVHNYLKSKGVASTKEQIGIIFNEVHESFFKELPNYVVLLPDVLNFLKQAKDKKIKMAVISSDTNKNTREVLVQLGILKYFDAIIGRDSFLEQKPHRILADKAIHLLKVKNNHTIIMGDAVMDMLLGKNADLQASIGVALGLTTIDDLRKETPFIISKYGELYIE